MAKLITLFALFASFSVILAADLRRENQVEAATDDKAKLAEDQQTASSFYGYGPVYGYGWGGPGFGYGYGSYGSGYFGYPGFGYGLGEGYWR